MVRNHEVTGSIPVSSTIDNQEAVRPLSYCVCSVFFVVEYR